MTAKIQLRRDSATNWAASAGNTLATGEVGVEIEANAVVGIKINGNSAATAYNALDYLAGTLPERSTSSIADLDDLALRKNGRYTWAAASSLSTNTPFTTTVDDGAAHLLTLTFGASPSINIAQYFHTEGNGTVPSKFYTRLFDSGASAFRAWTPTTNWASNASTGTAITCTTLDAKGVATFADGSAALPSIAHSGDLDTGISFPSVDTLVLSTNGNARLTIGSAGGATFASNALVQGTLTASGNTTLNGNLSVAGALSAALNAGAFKITNLADPTSAQDSVTKAYLESARVNQIALVAVTGGVTATIPFQVVGIATSGFTIVSQSLRAPAGTTWKGFAVNGSGAYCGITVTDSAAPTITNTSQNDVTGYGSGNFFHCVLVRTA